MQNPTMHPPIDREETLRVLESLFPGCTTEKCAADGTVQRGVDFDQLKQQLADAVVEGPAERYQLNWPGKREALLTANQTTSHALRPNTAQSVNFDSTRNLFIEGDNLDALKLLQASYLGKIKLIYIDPPYNTGNDFVYKDSFASPAADFFKKTQQKDAQGQRLTANTLANGRFHSHWLSMMYPRLRLAKSLLRPDGALLISIDDHEQHNLRKICDEIFGAAAFVGVFSWRARTAKADVPFGVSNDVEWVVAYGGPEFVAGRAGERKYFHSEDHAEGWRLQDLTKNTSKHERPNSYFTMVNPKNGDEFPSGENRTWSVTKDTFPEHYQNGKIVFPGDYDFLNIRRPAFRVFESEDKAKALKKYGSEDVKMSVSTYLPESVGRTEHGTKEIRELFGASVFSYPKPVSLIQFFVENCSDPDAIVLDFFAGSGTTAQAVLQQNAKDGGNRRFILVQLPEALNPNQAAQRAAADWCQARARPLLISELTKERIRLAGHKVLASACHENWGQDTGFRVLEIDTSNRQNHACSPGALRQQDLMHWVDPFKPDRTAHDLLFQLMVDGGMDLASPIRHETLQGHELFWIDGDALVGCLDPGGTIDPALAEQLAKRKPVRVVVRESLYADTAAKINVEQVFQLWSPATELRCL